MSIDPYNLGPPVYKKDQVITQEELVNIGNELIGKTVDIPLSSVEAERLDAALSVLDVLINWIKTGKPLEEK